MLLIPQLLYLLEMDKNSMRKTLQVYQTTMTLGGGKATNRKWICPSQNRLSKITPWSGDKCWRLAFVPKCLEQYSQTKILLVMEILDEFICLPKVEEGHGLIRVPLIMQRGLADLRESRSHFRQALPTLRANLWNH